MSAALVILGFAVLCLAVAVGATLRLVWLTKADHAKCIAHIASVTSNRFMAQALRDIADRYDSVDGYGEIARIRNVVWEKAGPSVPALWLREQADRIEADS